MRSSIATPSRNTDAPTVIVFRLKIVLVACLHLSFLRGVGRSRPDAPFQRTSLKASPNNHFSENNYHQHRDNQHRDTHRRRRDGSGGSNGVLSYFPQFIQDKHAKKSSREDSGKDKRWEPERLLVFTSCEAGQTVLGHVKYVVQGQRAGDRVKTFFR